MRGFETHGARRVVIGNNHNLFRSSERRYFAMLFALKAADKPQSRIWNSSRAARAVSMPSAMTSCPFSGRGTSEPPCLKCCPVCGSAFSWRAGLRPFRVFDCQLLIMRDVSPVLPAWLVIGRLKIGHVQALKLSARIADGANHTGETTDKSGLSSPSSNNPPLSKNGRFQVTAPCPNRVISNTARRGIGGYRFCPVPQCCKFADLVFSWRGCVCGRVGGIGKGFPPMFKTPATARNASSKPQFR